MKISDQGFSERLPAQANTAAVDNAASRSGSTRAASTSTSDMLQLSSLATQLQNASGADATRTTRVSSIAAAVKNNTFQVDPGRVSSAIVSEAIQGGAR
jgi:anti-sigma28 factor (negative regulator of flagellin synthesis)